MKRASTKTKNDVHSHFSLFVWETCEFCQQEFRREKGWCWVSQGRFMNYACSSCCSSAQECQDKIDERHRKIVWNRPTLPSTPPPKKDKQGD